jgi:molecular chaperone DnaJ
MTTTKDYYNILEIDKKSSKDDIKKAYRRLAMRYHPDKNTDPGAEAKFKDINEANDVLSDDKKRMDYDNPRPKSNPFNNYRGGSSNFSGFSMDDLFTNVRKQAAPLQPLYYNCNLKDLYDEKRVQVTFDRHIHSPNIVCAKCKGTGFLGKHVEDGYEHMVMCDDCFGTGRHRSDDIKTEKRTVEFKLTTDQIILRGQGDQSGNGVYSDLLITLSISPDKDFTLIDKMNILTQKKVPLVDFLVGGEIVISHFDGDIKMKYASDGKLVQKYRIPKKGLKVTSGHGDLFVEISPLMPSKITDSEKESLAKLATQENFNAQYRTP